MNWIKNNWKSLVAIMAAGVMYYTPTHIDLIIESCLAAVGIASLKFK